MRLAATAVIMAGIALGSMGEWAASVKALKRVEAEKQQERAEFEKQRIEFERQRKEFEREQTSLRGQVVVLQRQLQLPKENANIARDLYDDGVFRPRRQR